ncbi:MAG: hypothetical protein EP344_14095 [Bacteroidetes bacterium]|nr:MAG: hypothetical protein EP344_14095 [Bacteroidota bacterium]
MHPKYLRLAFSLAVVLAICGNIRAQETQPDSSTIVYIRTIDGNVFTGTIVGQDSAAVQLQTEHFGRLSIERQVIRAITPLGRIKKTNGKYWFDNPYLNRYLVGPSSYSMPKGTWSYDNGMAFFNQFGYGFTDRFSMSVGFLPFIILDGPFPVWVAPKFSIPLKRNVLNMSLGAFWGRSFSMYEDERVSFGAAYGQFTLGSPDVNLSAGFGLGSADNNWGEAPIISLSGIARISARFALLTENYFFVDNGDRFSMVSFGGRFIGRRIGFDLAVVSPVIQDDGIYPIPWIGVHVPFGNMP